MDTESASPTKVPWNKGKIVGQKAPLKLKDIWAIRIRLELGHRTRELALFDLGLDSKLRACDLVRLRVRCWRRLNIDQLCRFKIDQGLKLAFYSPAVDNYSSRLCC